MLPRHFFYHLVIECYLDISLSPGDWVLPQHFFITRRLNVTSTFLYQQGLSVTSTFLYHQAIECYLDISLSLGDWMLPWHFFITRRLSVTLTFLYYQAIECYLANLILTEEDTVSSNILEELVAGQVCSKCTRWWQKRTYFKVLFLVEICVNIHIRLSISCKIFLQSSMVSSIENFGNR